MKSLDNIFHSTLQQNAMSELLELNDKINNRGLFITTENATEIMLERERTLKNTGRVELDISVTKTIALKLSESDYINKDNFIEAITDIHEVFHCLKNSTSDFESDEEIINAIIYYYNNFCNGSTEYLMGKGYEKIMENYKNNRELSEITKNPEDEAYWYFDEQED